jgi:diacylglycerol kinase (ATP)
MASPASRTREARTIARVARSFKFAFDGMVTVTRTQPNFVIHLVAAAVALGTGVLLRLSNAELALIVLTIGVVLACEALNTAVEAVCDAVSPTYHPLIKRAKDASAAAVLITAIGAVVIAVLVFIPHFR